MLKVPPKPPNQIDIDIVRTRGTCCPLNGPKSGTIVERSAGLPDPGGVTAVRPEGTILQVHAYVPIRRIYWIEIKLPVTHT